MGNNNTIGVSFLNKQKMIMNSEEEIGFWKLLRGLYHTSVSMTFTLEVNELLRLKA